MVVTANDSQTLESKKNGKANEQPCRLNPLEPFELKLNQLIGPRVGFLVVGGNLVMVSVGRPVFPLVRVGL
jgi:hypothetical protein